MNRTIALTLGSLGFASLFALAVVSPPERQAQAQAGICEDPTYVCVPTIESVEIFRDLSTDTLLLVVIGTDAQGAPVDRTLGLAPTQFDDFAAEFAWRSCVQFAKKGMTNKKVDFWFSNAKAPNCGNVLAQ